MNEEQNEAKRLVKAIDICCNRLSYKEKKFIINLIDKQPAKLSEKQINWINAIADKYNIL